MRGLRGVVLAILQCGVYGLRPSFVWPQSMPNPPTRGSKQLPNQRPARLHGALGKADNELGLTHEEDIISPHVSKAKDDAKPDEKVTLYEEFSKYADRTAVAQDVIFEITSTEHFDSVVSRAAGADEATAGGYEDSQGNWRIPHKLMMVEVHAGWCRVCKGLQPKLLKLIANHPEVLCCKINKTQNEGLAGKLGVRGLPMIIFYKNGKRIDHFTTANINTIEEAIRDNS